MELLAESRNTLINKTDYPDEHDISDEEPRIGVFVCHCGINIASVIDVERVVKVALNEPDVVMATNTMFACSDASLSEIKDSIHKHRLNRVVVASCSPRTHEPLFRETMREAGLNPYLFELANIISLDTVFICMKTRDQPIHTKYFSKSGLIVFLLFSSKDRDRRRRPLGFDGTCSRPAIPVFTKIIE